MRNSKEKQKEIREIKLVDENINFTFFSNGCQREIKSIKAGSSYIISTYFQDEYPNESSIEKALDYIEYEFTKHKELRNNNETLVCKNKLLSEVMNVGKEKNIKREKIEETFDKYIDCAYGEPASILGIDYTLEKLTMLIIVRSVMYYLNFSEIAVLK